MSRTSLSTSSPRSDLQEWLHVVEQLLTNVKTWAEAGGWLVSTTTKEITERAFGTYHVQQLYIKAPQGTLILEPIARTTASGDGRVDLYAWPSMRGIRIIRRSNKWVVRTDAAINRPRPWDKESFTKLANQLVEPE
jgi:hypothetical protein